jgi:hypothetical protein
VVSLLLFLRSREGKRHRGILLAISTAAYVAALGAKEIAIILPCLVLCYAALYASGTTGERLRSGLKNSLPFFASTACYLTWRVYLLGGLGGYRDSDPMGAAQMYTYLMNVIQGYARDLLYPVDFLHILSNDATHNLTPLVILYGAVYLLVYARIARDRGYRDPRLAIFFGIWLLGPLALFLATTTFSHRSMYLSAVPFCGLVALPLLESIRWFSRTTKRRMAGCEANRTSLRLVKSHALAVALGIILVFSLVAFSPVLRSYNHWRDSARISHLFLDRLCEGSAELSHSSAIHIYNLPDRIQSYLQTVPHAREVTYLQHYSIKSWLNLEYPHNRMKVTIHTRSWPVTFPVNLKVSIGFIGKEQLWALVELDRRPVEMASVHRRRSRN